MKVLDNQQESDWIATEWVDEAIYHKASISPGADRIGSTASQYTQEESRGKGIKQAEKAADKYFARLIKRFER